MKDTTAIPPEPAATTTADEAPNLFGFWSLIITQFQGAFSDNLYRVLALFTFLDLAIPEYPAFDAELADRAGRGAFRPTLHSVLDGSGVIWPIVTASARSPSAPNWPKS